MLNRAPPTKLRTAPATTGIRATVLCAGPEAALLSSKPCNSSCRPIAIPNSMREIPHRRTFKPAELDFVVSGPTAPSVGDMHQSPHSFLEQDATAGHHSDSFRRKRQRPLRTAQGAISLGVRERTLLRDFRTGGDRLRHRFKRPLPRKIPSRRSHLPRRAVKGELQHPNRKYGLGSCLCQSWAARTSALVS